jgi:cation transport protein ChaC
MRRRLARDFVNKAMLSADKQVNDASYRILIADEILLGVHAMPAKLLSGAVLSNGDDVWVFGYGSLMWRPGFEFIEQVPARLIGEHRALCVYSFDHRGTPEKPGLVLGLDRGGACRGIAFRIAAKRRSDTIDYLRSREQTTHVYREVMRSVWLENEARQRISALAYVVDRGHVQYAGRLSLAEQLRHVKQGHGRSGNNRDYVLSTVKSIEAQGFRDEQLHQLAQMLHDDTPLHPHPAPERDSR